MMRRGCSIVALRHEHGQLSHSPGERLRDLSGLPADQRVALRREMQTESNDMPIPANAPRLALVAGAATIGLDIYFKNRGTETPRQYVILLGEMVIKVWETLQDPAA